ncbi:hypothetical protein AB0J38_25875 [Streptomyces sp. NPDC050095]|uniref:hypothetical protein n=1 Tax=unclassified Streptomyces TaxID=2593676 RepID=UPI003439A50D
MAADRTPAEQALDESLTQLPTNPAAWTPQQLVDYAAQSNKVMEENATRPGDNG